MSGMESQEYMMEGLNDTDAMDEIRQALPGRENYEIVWLVRAIVDEPSGAVCSFCLNLNTFADDCGWFVACPEPEMSGFCCHDCWHGEVGTKHVARFGGGDR